jgi:hypothetical protein
MIRINLAAPLLAKNARNGATPKFCDGEVGHPPDQKRKHEPSRVHCWAYGCGLQYKVAMQPLHTAPTALLAFHARRAFSLSPEVR